MTPMKVHRHPYRRGRDALVVHTDHGEPHVHLYGRVLREGMAYIEDDGHIVIKGWHLSAG